MHLVVFLILLIKQKTHTKRLYQLQDTTQPLIDNIIAQKVQQQFWINVSVGHINYLLRKKGATTSVGRPKTHKATIVADHTSPGPLPHAGIFLLEAAKQAMGVVETVEIVLQQAKEQYTREFPSMSRMVWVVILVEIRGWRLEIRD